jgi:hypothetical protein
MSSETLPYFAAVRPRPLDDESAIEVDVTDLESEDSTVPRQPMPERTTERPSADNLEALVDATRIDATWLAEPVFACDPKSCRLFLASPYTARQRDAWGNVFFLECPLGLSVELPTSPERARALRSELVRAALQVVSTFRVLPHTGVGELRSHLDDEWRRAIAEAVSMGDDGALERG